MEQLHKDAGGQPAGKKGSGEKNAGRKEAGEKRLRENRFREGWIGKKRLRKEDVPFAVFFCAVMAYYVWRLFWIPPWYDELYTMKALSTRG